MKNSGKKGSTETAAASSTKGTLDKIIQLMKMQEAGGTEVTIDKINTLLQGAGGRLVRSEGVVRGEQKVSSLIATESTDSLSTPLLAQQLEQGVLTKDNSLIRVIKDSSMSWKIKSSSLFLCLKADNHEAFEMLLKPPFIIDLTLPCRGSSGILLKTVIDGADRFVITLLKDRSYADLGVNNAEDLYSLLFYATTNQNAVIMAHLLQKTKEVGIERSKIADLLKRSVLIAGDASGVSQLLNIFVSSADLVPTHPAYEDFTKMEHFSRMEDELFSSLYEMDLAKLRIYITDKRATFITRKDNLTALELIYNWQKKEPVREIQEELGQIFNEVLRRQQNHSHLFYLAMIKSSASNPEKEYMDLIIDRALEILNELVAPEPVVVEEAAALHPVAVRRNHLDSETRDDIKMAAGCCLSKELIDFLLKEEIDLNGPICASDGQEIMADSLIFYVLSRKVSNEPERTDFLSYLMNNGAHPAISRLKNSGLEVTIMIGTIETARMTWDKVKHDSLAILLSPDALVRIQSIDASIQFLLDSNKALVEKTDALDILIQGLCLSLDPEDFRLSIEESPSGYKIKNLEDKKSILQALAVRSGNLIAESDKTYANELRVFCMEIWHIIDEIEIIQGFSMEGVRQAILARANANQDEMIELIKMIFPRVLSPGEEPSIQAEFFNGFFLEGALEKNHCKLANFLLFNGVEFNPQITQSLISAGKWESAKLILEYTETIFRNELLQENLHTAKRSLAAKIKEIDKRIRSEKGKPQQAFTEKHDRLSEIISLDQKAHHEKQIKNYEDEYQKISFLLGAIDNLFSRSASTMDIDRLARDIEGMTASKPGGKKGHKHSASKLSDVPSQAGVAASVAALEGKPAGRRKKHKKKLEEVTKSAQAAVSSLPVLADQAPVTAQAAVSSLPVPVTAQAAAASSASIAIEHAADLLRHDRLIEDDALTPFASPPGEALVSLCSSAAGSYCYISNEDNPDALAYEEALIQGGGESVEGFAPADEVRRVRDITASSAAIIEAKSQQQSVIADALPIIVQHIPKSAFTKVSPKLSVSVSAKVPTPPVIAAQIVKTDERKKELSAAGAPVAETQVVCTVTKVFEDQVAAQVIEGDGYHPAPYGYPPASDGFGYTLRTGYDPTSYEYPPASNGFGYAPACAPYTGYNSAPYGYYSASDGSDYQPHSDYNPAPYGYHSASDGFGGYQPHNAYPPAPYGYHSASNGFGCAPHSGYDPVPYNYPPSSDGFGYAPHSSYDPGQQPQMPYAASANMAGFGKREDQPRTEHKELFDNFNNGNQKFIRSKIEGLKRSFHGINSHITNSKKTILHLAVERDMIWLVRELLDDREHPVSLFQRDSYRKKPLDYALSKDCAEMLGNSSSSRVMHAVAETTGMKM